MVVFAVTSFRMGTLLQVKGENVLYVNIQVCVLRMTPQLMHWIYG
jgi:hypothetical protein